MKDNTVQYDTIRYDIDLAARLAKLNKRIQLLTRLLKEINLGETSPVPELSFLPAPYRGWTRASERRVQDNLHAHAQNEPIKNY